MEPEKENIVDVYLENKTGQIGGLNALRFFGAISVVFLHLGSWQAFEKLGWKTYHPLVSGNTGVILFYVISGFLITSLAIDEIKKFGSFALLPFIQRRALRLFPLYYLALFSIYILSLMDKTDVATEAWPYAIFYSYNFVPKSFYNGLIGAFHTLATEEQFYLVFGFLVFLIFSLRPKMLISIKFGFLVAVLWLCMRLNSALMSLPYIQQFNETHLITRWLFAAADPLIIGCLFAILVRSTIVRWVMGKVALNENVSTAVFLSVFLLGVYMYMSWGLNVYHDPRPVEYLSVGISLILCSLFYFRSSLLTKCLEAKPLVYLGSISYGIYVWQAVINGTGSYSRWIESPYISTGLVMFLSVISYELYEKKFMAFKPYRSN